MPVRVRRSKAIFAFRLLLCTSVVLAALPLTLSFSQDAKQVLIVVGPSTHKPGTHEVGAGARLVKFCLEKADLPVKISATVTEKWPSGDKILQQADCVVFSGDRFPLAEFGSKTRDMQEMADMMERGCGLVCFHYATGLNAAQVPEDGNHPLLQWMGGYFATRCAHHQSVARIFEAATIVPAVLEHDVLRGVDEFTVHDEPYINNYFGPEGMAKNVKALATSMLPPESPKREVVAWAVERDDGGRGVGVVMPHFYRNWQVDSLRRLILNGIVWSAKVDVPTNGINVELPDLAAFEPAAVYPAPRKK